MPTHYQLLDLPPDATANAIRQAYRRLARTRHPDREEGSTEQMVALNLAYETLRDPRARAEYDRSISPGSRGIPDEPTRAEPAPDPYEFLTKEFAVADAQVRSAVQDLERAIEAIAYDVYDDAYIAAFSAATQRVEEQITAVQSRLRPKRVPDCFREAVGLYLQGLRHLDEALGEFETFVEGYDIDSLVTGREFFLTGQDILLAARQSLLSRT